MYAYILGVDTGHEAECNDGTLSRQACHTTATHGFVKQPTQGV